MAPNYVLDTGKMNSRTYTDDRVMSSKYGGRLDRVVTLRIRVNVPRRVQLERMLI